MPRRRCNKAKKPPPSRLRGNAVAAQELSKTPTRSHTWYVRKHQLLADLLYAAEEESDVVERRVVSLAKEQEEVEATLFILEVLVKKIGVSALRPLIEKTLRRARSIMDRKESCKAELALIGERCSQYKKGFDELPDEIRDLPFRTSDGCLLFFGPTTPAPDARVTPPPATTVAATSPPSATTPTVAATVSQGSTTKTQELPEQQPAATTSVAASFPSPLHFFTRSCASSVGPASTTHSALNVAAELSPPASLRVSPEGWSSVSTAVVSRDATGSPVKELSPLKLSFEEDDAIDVFVAETPRSAATSPVPDQRPASSDQRRSCRRISPAERRVAEDLQRLEDQNDNDASIIFVGCSPPVVAEDATTPLGRRATRPALHLHNGTCTSAVRRRAPTALVDAATPSTAYVTDLTVVGSLRKTRGSYNSDAVDESIAVFIQCMSRYMLQHFQINIWARNTASLLVLSAQQLHDLHITGEVPPLQAACFIDHCDQETEPPSFIVYQSSAHTSTTNGAVTRMCVSFHRCERSGAHRQDLRESVVSDSSESAVLLALPASTTVVPDFPDSTKSDVGPEHLSSTTPSKDSLLVRWSLSSISSQLPAAPNSFDASGSSDVARASDHSARHSDPSKSARRAATPPRFKGDKCQLLLCESEAVYKTPEKAFVSPYPCDKKSKALDFKSVQFEFRTVINIVSEATEKQEKMPAIERDSVADRQLASRQQQMKSGSNIDWWECPFDDCSLRKSFVVFDTPSLKRHVALYHQAPAGLCCLACEATMATWSDLRVHAQAVHQRSPASCYEDADWDEVDITSDLPRHRLAELRRKQDRDAALAADLPAGAQRALRVFGPEGGWRYENGVVVTLREAAASSAATTPPARHIPETAPATPTSHTGRKQPTSPVRPAAPSSSTPIESSTTAAPPDVVHDVSDVSSSSTVDVVDVSSASSAQSDTSAVFSDRDPEPSQSVLSVKSSSTSVLSGSCCSPEKLLRRPVSTSLRISPTTLSNLPPQKGKNGSRFYLHPATTQVAILTPSVLPTVRGANSDVNQQQRRTPDSQRRHQELQQRLTGRKGTVLASRNGHPLTRPTQYCESGWFFIECCARENNVNRCIDMHSADNQEEFTTWTPAMLRRIIAWKDAASRPAISCDLRDDGASVNISLAPTTLRVWRDLVEVAPYGTTRNDEWKRYVHHQIVAVHRLVKAEKF